MNKNFENGVIKTLPKKWAKEEEKELLKLKEEGFNNKYISEKFGRSEISIGIKYKRLHKTDNSYNKKHIQEKELFNELFFRYIKPNSVLDCYAGNGYYSRFDIKKYISNDKDYSKNTNYNLDAFEFMSKFYNKSFDLVDIDPFGSGFDCIDLGIKIAKKGLIITLGEIGHKRFKRLDFVKDRYGIENLTDDWYKKIIDYIINRGKIYKKNLTIIYKKDWGNIGRIYFEVNKYKETSQWENNF